VALPHVVRFCGDAGPGWRALPARVGDQPVDAAALGSGPAVVLLNESDNDACAWVPEASMLAEQGFRVVLWRYTNSDDEPGSVREVLAVADAARGDAKALMVGASIGGRIVFEAAARRPSAFAGIVSVSGERRVQTLPDIRSVVARVTIPVLYVGSRDDPYTEGTRQPRSLRRALRSREQKFELVDGSDHGLVLLASGAGASLRLEIEAFLAAHR
jgi:pimeloyl-ACP methyl ester carboxylesterase